MPPYFSVRDKCFKEGRYRLEGVRPLLAKWYWPQEQNAVREGGMWRGFQIGRRVDREISFWAKAPTREPARKLHPYTLKLIAAFSKWQWTPVSSQLVVGSRAIGGVATAIDLVMRTPEGGLVILEVKCGYDGYWDTASGQLLAPFTDIPNSPLIQATAQLLFGHFLLTRTNPHVRPRHAFVVNVNKAGVQRYPAPLDWGPRFMKDLTTRCQARIDARKQSKPKPKAGPPTPTKRPKPNPVTRSTSPIVID